MSTYANDFQYICRSCNAPFSARDLERAQNGIIRCSQCGYHTALPKKDQLQEVLLQLSHGRNELDNGRFDAASDTYRRAIELAEQNQKHEPEAYFGMALAKYRVQYLYDEVYRRNQPICYRVMEKRFSENEYYQKALRYATGEQQELYRARAEEIDSIMDCFRDLDRRGIDYDVFLCVKVSEEGPVKRYTDDSHRADQIYRILEKKGYRPFYSEMQLTDEDSIGKTYEPHILYALQKAKAMLLICSDEDYLYSKWVKNEYMRYYRLMQQGKKERGSLAVVYQGTPIEHIPGIQSNGSLQGVDFSKFNASDLLTAFVKRYTEAIESDYKTIEKREEERKEKERLEAEIQRRKQEEERRKAEERLEAEIQRRKQEEERRKAEERLEAELRREQKKERRRARAIASKKRLPTIAISILVLLAIAASVICSIVFVNARHWIIAVAIGIVYTLLWNLIRYKSDFDYVPWYILTNIGLSVACIPLYCISDTTRAYAFGFALAVFASSIGLLAKCWADKEVETSTKYDRFTRTTVYENNYSFKLNPREYISTFYFMLIGGVLLAIAIGCLFSGMTMALVTGCGIAVIYVAMTVLATFLYCDNDVELNFFLFDIVMGVTSIAFFFVSFNFVVCAICLIAAAILSCLVLAIRRNDNQYYGYAVVGVVLAGIAVLVLLFGHEPDTNEFKIKDGVLISYGGTEEVVVIPEEVTAIGGKAFKHSGPQNNMKEVVMHDGITSIGIAAFKNCDALTSVTIPKGVTTIPTEAFYDCEKLASVTFHDEVTSIGNSAFEYCDALKTVTLPEGMLLLGSYCFSSCINLTEFYINSNLEHMDTGIFSNAAPKMTIYYDGTEEEWNNIETSAILKWTYCINQYEIIYNYDIIYDPE